MREAALELGVSHSTLSVAAQAHPLYAPAVRGLAGLGAFGASVCRYHAEQIRLLQAAMVGNLDIETATLQWQIFKRHIGNKTLARSAGTVPAAGHKRAGVAS